MTHYNVSRSPNFEKLQLIDELPVTTQASICGFTQGTCILVRHMSLILDQASDAVMPHMLPGQFHEAAV